MHNVVQYKVCNVNPVFFAVAHDIHLSGDNYGKLIQCLFGHDLLRDTYDKIPHDYKQKDKLFDVARHNDQNGKHQIQHIEKSEQIIFKNLAI